MSPLCPCCGDPTPLPSTYDAGRVETARACVRSFDDEHAHWFMQNVETPTDLRPTPRHVPLFGLRAGRVYGTTYHCNVGQVLYTATSDDDGWSVAIHCADSFPHLASCWAMGRGASIAEAEAACERMLRREGRRRSETAAEIAERRRQAA